MLSAPFHRFTYTLWLWVRDARAYTENLCMCLYRPLAFSTPTYCYVFFIFDFGRLGSLFHSFCLFLCINNKQPV